MRSASQRKSSSGKSENTSNLRISWMKRSTCAPLSISVISHRVQILMHELNSVCAFSDARGDPFDGTITHIAGDEHAGDARFQQPLIAVERPALGTFPLGHEVSARQDIALFLAEQNVREPICAGGSADENEQVIGENFLRFPGGGAQD